MTVRTIVRRAALGVPPIRRLWQRSNTLMGELAAVSEERDSLEAQLYVLRADHQRTLARADATRREMSGLREALASAEQKLRKGAPEAIELLYAKLAGQMTRGFGMFEVQLRGMRESQATHSSAPAQIGLYLDLLERAVTGQLVKDDPISPWSSGFDRGVRELGRDWPGLAQTMIGAARIRNIRVLAERILEAGIPGDFLEAGIWRGGACILMRGILAAYGVKDRMVWAADSFAGLPAPDSETYPADAGDAHHTARELVVPLDEVRANFELYGLLDDQVKFLEGWFADTLPMAPIEKLAILRLDGDMYSSTIQTLEALYKKVAPGGFVIVDDYILAGCRRAVDDFRDREGIIDLIEDIDGAGVFWRKSV